MIFENEQAVIRQYGSVLTPIAAENPVGRDLRTAADTDWSDLRDARKGERPGVLTPEGSDPPTVIWADVESQAVKALSTRTKDLQIAMWLVQALIAQTGFDGAYAGAIILRELVERYWGHGLYPADDEDGEDEVRLGLLDWFDNELAGWIRSVPVTPLVNGSSYSVGEYEFLQRKTKRTQWWSEEQEQDRILVSNIQREAVTGGIGYFEDTFANIDRIRQQFERFAAQPLNNDGTYVSLSRSISALGDCERTIREWLAAGNTVPLFTRKWTRSDPDAIQDDWQRSLALIRLQEFDKASDLIERTLTDHTTERERFFRKLELAEVLSQIERHDLATGILQLLAEQVEHHDLRSWEGERTAIRVWKLLLECYRRNSQDVAIRQELERKLNRAAPWLTLR